MQAKYKTANTVVGLCCMIFILFGFVYWSQIHEFSKSKWNNGHREDIIYDVIENYIYPGVSLTEVKDKLSSGISVDENTEAGYLALFDLDNSMYDVIIYQISNDYNDLDNIRNSYFVIIHDSEVVVKTLFVDSLS